jgi:hypothetical protein
MIVMAMDTPTMASLTSAWILAMFAFFDDERRYQLGKVATTAQTAH